MGNGVAAPEDGNARNGNKRKNPKAREGRDAQGASGNAEKKVEQAPINLNDFPSLAGSAPTNTGYSKPKMYGRDEMISIFKETKAGEVEAGKRGAAEDASQNKAHEHGSSEASNNGAGEGEKASSAPNAQDATPKEGDPAPGAGSDNMSSAAMINGSSAVSAAGGPKKMSYAQMANASKAAAAAVST